jgi:hypothetical protein
MANNTEERKVRIIADGKQAEASIKQMRAASALLNAELAKLPKNSKAFADKMKEFQEVQRQLRETTREVHQLQSASQKFWTDFKKLAGAVVGGNLITGFISKLQDVQARALKMKLEIEEALIDVKKVSGLTNAEIQRLQKNLNEMNTRTSRKELLDLAWTAGKLGKKGVEDITSFVKAADKIKVALGKDLGNEAIQQIGKLTSIFQLEGKFGTEEAMLKIGSAINEVGMASTANEAYLVEFSKRLSGISGIAQLTAPDIIGLAGTLDSLGQTSEVSSTALSKLFVKMGKDVEVFSKFAKMEVQDFSRLLQEDAMSAFIAVLEGVKGTASGLESLSATLGELGLDGGRVVGVLGSLSNNTQELRRQLELSNQAFDKGTSVTKEFALKNQSAQASVERLYKWLNKLLSDNIITKGFTNLLISTSKLVAKNDEMIVSIQNERRELLRLQLELKDTNLTTERRSEIIKTLQSQYPEYLKYIDAEKMSNEELSSVLDGVNKGLIAKLYLRKLEMQAEEVASTAADKYLDRANKEEKVLELMQKMLDKYKEINVATLEGNNILEQSTDLYKKIRDLQREKGIQGAGRLFDPVSEFGAQITELRRIDGFFQAYEDRYNQAMANIQKEQEKISGQARGTSSVSAEPDWLRLPVEDKKDLDSLTTKIRDMKTKLIEDERARSKKLLKDQLDDEIAAVDKSTALESEKNQMKSLLRKKYRLDLQEIDRSFDEKEKEAAYNAQLELLRDFEMTEKVFFAKQREQGQINEKESNEALLQLEIEMLEMKKALAVEYGKEIYDIELALAKARTAAEVKEEEKKKLSLVEEQRMRMEIQREGSKQRLAEHKKLLELSMLEELNTTEVTEEQKQLIKDWYREEELRAEREHRERLVQIASSYIGELQNIYSSHNQILSNKEDAALIQFKADQDQKMYWLNERFSRELISQEEYEQLKKEIDDKTREEEKRVKTEQFKRQKQADIIQAGTNTALAITRALTVDPTGILATLVGIAGAAQIYAIQSKPMPQFADGGRTTVKGASDRRSYSAKSIGSFESGGVYSQPSVGLIGEKGPELVIPNWLYTAPATADLMGALENIIETRQFGNGGRTSDSNPINPMSNDDMKKFLGENFKVMFGLLAEVSKEMRNPKPAKILWNQTDYETFQGIEEKTKKMSSL